MKTIAMIPARMGSTRLKKKNLAMIDGKPMVSYAIRAALESGVFDAVYVNSEDPHFSSIASEYGAKFYLRSKEYATSDTKSDTVVLDFMRNNPADVTVWVNPVSPLQPASEISEVVRHFQAAGLDSLITTNLEQVHCLYDGKALNFVPGMFAQTQDLKPVERFVYSLMMWRNDAFMLNMEKDGHALMGGRFGTRVVSKLSGIIVKNESDFELVESIIRGTAVRSPEKAITYHDEANP